MLFTGSVGRPWAPDEARARWGKRLRSRSTHARGNAAIQAWSWPNFWADTASFSLVGGAPLFTG
jgi:hypothetical protein